MTKFLLKRLIQAIPTLLGITVIAYFIMAQLPGGPVNALAFDPSITPQQRTAMAEAMGVNDPWYIQYSRWMIGDAPFILSLKIPDTEVRIFGGKLFDIGAFTIIPNIQIWGGREIPVFDRRGNQTGTEIGTNRGVLRGDFGHSLVSRQLTTEAIKTRLAATIELGALSLIVGTLIGIPVGVLAAVRQGGIFDNITRILAVFISAVPVFWLGLILLLIFGSWLQLLPMGGRFPISVAADYTLAERIRHLILPVLTLSSFSIATFSRFMRASLLDVLNQDYVRTARAKGLSNNKVWFTHAMRNALIPVATIIGPAIPGIIGGATLTETIYAWPGMGRLVVESVNQQDYPVIMGIVLVFSLATILGFILSDILYALFDPRIRLS